MSTIDNRVVHMGFDNKQFEQGVADSVSSLNQLKTSLELRGAEKGLQNIQKVGRAFSLASISDSVSDLASRFDALNVIATTTLVNLANTAVNAGKRLIASLTVDPIKTGLEEYETKINAIQTILTNTESKGTSLREVNAALDELNEYADLTIYNFAQMTDNVGKFTGAGLGLKDSVVTVKGLANVAAGFGVDAIKMAGATYQMSQALSAGVIKLQDWRSMEQASMGGEKIRNALIATGKEMGKVIDISVPFRESLESGWLTADVFVKTMEKMASDKSLVAAAQNVTTFTKLLSTMRESVTSGWAKTWEQIFGDKDQATALFTEMNNGFAQVAGASADSRNEVLNYWNVYGGRKAVIDGLAGALKNLSDVLNPIGTAFKEVFPAKTGPQLIEMSTRFRDFLKNFKMAPDMIEDTQTVFKGVFVIYDRLIKFYLLLTNVAIGFAAGMAPVLGAFIKITAEIINYYNAVGEATGKVVKFFDIPGMLISSFKKVGEVISGVLLGVATALGLFSTDGLDGITKLADGLDRGATAFESAEKKTVSAVDGITAAFAHLTPILKILNNTMGAALVQIGVTIGKFIEDLNADTVNAIINGTFFTLLIKNLKAIRKPIEAFKEIGSDLAGSIKSVLLGVKDCLVAYQQNLKADVLSKIAIAIGILAVSLLVLSGIDSAKLSDAMAAVTLMIAALFGAMLVFTKMGGLTGPAKLAGVVAMMMAMSVATLILSAAMRKLAELDWEGLKKGLLSISALMILLTGTAVALAKAGPSLTKGMFGLVVFAGAVAVLAKVVRDLGALNSSELTKGLVGVGVIIAELALFAKFAALSGMSIKAGASLLLLAFSVKILAKAVGEFAQLQPDAIKQGLAGMAGVLVAVGIFVKTVGNAQMLISTSIALAILSGSIILMAKGIAALGEIPVEKLKTGLTAMAVSIGVIAAALKVIPPNVMGTSIALIGVAFAIGLLSKSLGTMGEMTWDEVARGLTVLGGALGIIALATGKMVLALPGAAALLVVSAALGILAGTLKVLGSMPLPAIGAALLVLVGAFAILGGSALLLAPLIPIIAALSTSFFVMSAAVWVLGAGMIALATGIGLLTAVGVTGANSVISVFKNAVAMIPFIGEQLGKAAVNIAKAFGDGAATLGKVCGDIVLAILSNFERILPAATTTVINMVVLMLQRLSEQLPRLIDAGANLVVALIKGIQASLPKVIQAGFELIVGFIKGLADAIDANGDLLIDAIESLLMAVVNFSVKFMTGMISTFIDIGKTVIVDGFIGGILGSISAVGSAAKEVVTGAVDGVKQTLSEWTDAGKQVVDGFISGIRSKISDAAHWSGDLGQKVIDSAKAVLGIHSPSKVFKDEVGKMLGFGLADGIKESAEKPKKEAVKMADAVAKAGKEAFEKSTKWIDDRKYYNQLSLKEELEAWERLQKRYKEGSEERMKSDREVYRVQQELAKEAYQNSTEWIDDRKYYGQLGLQQELDAWERVQSRYLEGSDERKKADREVYRLKKDLVEANESYSAEVSKIEKDANEERISLEQEYYDRTKQINDRLKSDIQSVTDAYESALKSRTETLYKSYGLFDKVETKAPVDSSSLITNLEGQVAAFDSWKANLEKLRERGVSEALISELEQMGPEANDKLTAMVGMTDAQLTQFQDLWGKKYSGAREQATEELEGMRQDSVDQIRQLRSEAAEELSEYQVEWAAKMKVLKENTTTELEAIRVEWLKKIGGLTTDTEKKMTTMTDNIIKTIQKPDWSAIGGGIIEGIQQGLRSKESDALDEVERIGLALLEKMRDTLEVNSPSRKFAELGKFSVLGFVEGLKSYSGKAVNSAGDLANDTIIAFRSTISRISDAVTNGIDAEPTIRPVLDLTDVINGADKLNALFKTPKSIDLARSVSASAQQVQNRSQSPGDNPADVAPTKIEFNQYNHSPKALSRIDIYRQTKNQISSLKGVVIPT